MGSYGIGEVEELLGLPASTLRHWERVVPLLSPRKDPWGRRVYSESDLRILLRLRHLALDRGLGIGSAAEALLGELSAPEGELRSRLAEIRGELISLYFDNKSAGASLGRPSPEPNSSRRP